MNNEPKEVKTTKIDPLFDFSEVKAGDILTEVGNYIGYQRPVTVERTTKTLIVITGGIRFRRSTGQGLNYNYHLLNKKGE